MDYFLFSNLPSSPPFHLFHHHVPSRQRLSPPSCCQPSTLSFIIPWSPHPTTSHQTNRPSDPTQMGALLYRLTSNVGRTATTAGSSSVPPLNPNSTTASTTTPTIGNLVVAHCICLLSWKRGKEEEPEHVPHQHQRSKMTHPCRGPSIVHPRRVALRLAPSSWERRRI